MVKNGPILYGGDLNFLVEFKERMIGASMDNFIRALN
jgi:hypothetical protein